VRLEAHLPDAEGRRRILRLLGVATFVLPLVLSVLVVREVLTDPPPGAVEQPTETSRHGLSLRQRKEIFGKLAKMERRWRREARMEFPDHEWSRSDHYFKLVRERASHLSRVHGVHYSVIYLIYDEGIRRRWPDGRGEPLPASVPPLDPRKE
jgi:hypothetical protein